MLFRNMNQMSKVLTCGNLIDQYNFLLILNKIISAVNHNFKNFFSIFDPRESFRFRTDLNGAWRSEWRRPRKKEQFTGLS